MILTDVNLQDEFSCDIYKVKIIKIITDLYCYFISLNEVKNEFIKYY